MSNIPEAAVEAAARYVWDKSNSPIPWSQATNRARAIYLQDARWALESVAQSLLAEAWDAGESAGQDNAGSNSGHDIEHKYNPYRPAT